MAYRAKSVIASWQSQSLSTRILRLWLGVTWIYGGWEKAADPGFLTPGHPTYIGNQIAGFIGNSPLTPLLNHANEHALLIGWSILVTEFATGISTMLFIVPRFAALVGFGTSVSLWLTVTYHVKPYFLGSDTAYAVMWLAYFLVLYSSNKKVDFKMDRRSILRVGSVFGFTAGFIGLANLFPRKGDSAVASGGKKIVALKKVPVGGNYKFVAASGEPAMLFRTNVGVFAYSLICTHQGCTVAFNKSSKHFECPCHGASYDPYKGAKVLAGPAPRPLNAIKVKISGINIVEV